MIMRVSEILSAKGASVVSVRQDATVTAAIHRMTLERIGALVVSNDGQHIDGILSERDVIRALSHEGNSILEPERKVAEIMTRDVEVCAVEDSTKEVMRRMTAHRIRHLPVVEGGRLAGMVSIGDVVKSRLEELQLETGVLRDAWIATH
jgi:CBS domain-containing protein